MTHWPSLTTRTCGPGWRSIPGHAALHSHVGVVAMFELFFGIITRQAIRRGTFTSVRDLIGAIETFIDGWNGRCQPFTWTKTADQLLPHCKPGKEPRPRDTRIPDLT